MVDFKRQMVRPIYYEILLLLDMFRARLRMFLNFFISISSKLQPIVGFKNPISLKSSIFRVIGYFSALPLIFARIILAK